MILRYQLNKFLFVDSGFDMPSHWAPMDQNENIKIVPLQTTDKEYNDVVQEFQTNMGGNYSTIIKVIFNCCWLIYK